MYKYSYNCKYVSSICTLIIVSIYNLKLTTNLKNVYVTEDNCRCDGVSFQNNGTVKVQKFEDNSNDENTIYSVKPMRTFLGKSQVCNMNMFSGAKNKSVFDGNTI